MVYCCYGKCDVLAFVTRLFAPVRISIGATMSVISTHCLVTQCQVSTHCIHTYKSATAVLGVVILFCVDVWSAKLPRHAGMLACFSSAMHTPCLLCEDLSSLMWVDVYGIPSILTRGFSVATPPCNGPGSNLSHTRVGCISIIEPWCRRRGCGSG